MKTAFRAFVAGSLLLACSDRGGDEEPVDQQSEALNGTLTVGGNLTKKTFPQANEVLRQADTNSYYSSVAIGPTGVGGGTITSALSTSQAFYDTYLGDVLFPPKAKYYNRGDLGIGRSMLCVDNLSVNTPGDPRSGTIACSVANFAAGDDDSEFTFGMSSSIAFANMDALPLPKSFATVAMVFRNQMPANAPNKVFFVVYGKDGALQNFAALDRHGQNFANGFKAAGGVNPDPSFGTPGVNFNNHIPTNCAACHRGTYNASNHSITGGLFLPFDLDQFDYSASHSRDSQLGEFQRLNELVRRVDALSGSPGASNVVKQLDDWYSNVPGPDPDPATEVFENPFNSAFVPGGWIGHTATYQSVVRGSCRNCHMAQEDPFSFGSAADFLSLASSAVQDLCDYEMPHSLQTVRLFWQSTQPASLKAFLDANGHAAEGTQLAGCDPGTVATLDPHLIHPALSVVRD